MEVIVENISFEKYPVYKYSGVKWLGDVPEGWDIKKLKEICSAYGRIGFRGYTTNDLVGEDEGAITISPSNISENEMSFNKCSYLSWVKYEESPEIKIYNEDILIVKTGSTYGKIGYVKNLMTKATINPQLLVLKKIKINNSYLYYQLLTPIIQTQIERDVVGSTIPTISESKILNFVSLVPTYNEQIAIASFLDRKTAQIDKAINIKERQIELLKERRQILIHQAVTRGLNTNVKMKDSGVEWIGEIPEHWGIKKLKYLFRLVGGGTPSKDRKDFWDGDIPWVSPKDMKVDCLSSTEDSITEKGLNHSTTSLIEENTLLMVVRSGILQRTIPVAISKVRLSMNQDMKAFVKIGDVSTEYLFYFIKGNDSFLKNDWVKQGATVESVEVELMKNGYILVPPKGEQSDISNYIDSITSKISTAFSCKEREIEKLKEYKATLINSAVTGKIKVSQDA